MSIIHTIGHSTRTTEQLLELLRGNGIRTLVDVRRYPGSRRHPHFSDRALAASLEAAGMRYAHEPDLGGRRDGRPDSPNDAWRNASFRAYADHMEDAGFRAALARVLQAAEHGPTTLMCAEAVPWRCHRQLIADALVAGGHEVRHITGPGEPASHTLSPHARVVGGGRVIYPAASQQMGLFG